jgi:hypothetical protein
MCNTSVRLIKRLIAPLLAKTEICLEILLYKANESQLNLNEKGSKISQILPGKVSLENDCEWARLGA